ncbi:N-acetylglucosamine-6-phosphate deacetylase [Corynebacterium glyciniphilum AJ 3170]|uniref:N-acetylglucosamine-6-phosphate deacetylase n=1 Tax=Corynebacterium glyciniphilum AJ 3170 TaxID=1404245 RepID=X5E7V0_9CORY|nr:N-acetylglucosamine-6-phosphate deacetylase [Corynebacterium glyciniphilum]AHW62746.1 N-acetylglucosamine-6-phosphate deacetylase [Corynebacterium glyciniphilum AJ 3170]
MLVTAGVLVTGEEVLRPGWMEISDGSVTALGLGDPPRPTADGDLALGDVTVVPGFVDMHVHGGGGGAFPVATDEETATAVAMHAAHGTTTIMASLVSAHPDELLRQVDVLSGHVRDGLVAGIHLEGPWLAPSKKGAHDPTALRNPDPGEITRVLDAARDTVRMATVAPELDGGVDAIRQLVDAGVVAAVGHTDASYEQTLTAIDAGARVGTHLFNAMRPVHHREPGPVTALVEDPRVTVEMIGDGVHLHPSLYRGVCELVGPDRVTLVTDAMAAAGMPDGSYRLGTLGVDVVDGVARVAGTDTIAGSTATMDQLFRFAVAHGTAGSTDATDRDAALLQAVRQTSVNPARAVGFPTAGLHVGGRADLVVLNGALQVELVIRGGERVQAR